MDAIDERLQGEATTMQNVEQYLSSEDSSGDTKPLHSRAEHAVENLLCPYHELVTAYAKTLDIVRKKAPRLVSGIFDDWEKLKYVSHAYSNVLQRRWAKKTVDKRRKILLDAWPSLSPEHRPEYHALMNGLKGSQRWDA